MCGRYTLKSSGEAVARHFALASVPELAPRYNIAPTQRVPAVRMHAGDRQLAPLHWGLVPHWARDRAIASRLINARGETAALRPAFRDALRARRCLLPMDGFFEWQRRGGRRTPVWIHARDGGLLAAAGLWEQWTDARGERLESCTVLTTAANEVVAPIHGRMPVLLARADFDRWLDPAQSEPAALQPLLVPCPPGWLAARAVASRVNDARREGPACLAPPEPPPQPGLFAGD